MNKPHITQVRQVLLDTLADLRNKQDPMDIERAKAVATVASVLIDTARVENDFLKISGQDQSDFMERQPNTMLSNAAGDAPSAHNPFPVSAVHRLQG